MEKSQQSDEAINSIVQDLKEQLDTKDISTEGYIEEETKEGASKPKGLDSNKLYQVIKALSAMRLCKSDSTPSPILVRNPGYEGADFSKLHLLYDQEAHQDYVPSIY